MPARLTVSFKGWCILSEAAALPLTTIFADRNPLSQRKFLLRLWSAAFPRPRNEDERSDSCRKTDHTSIELSLTQAAKTQRTEGIPPLSQEHAIDAAESRKPGGQANAGKGRVTADELRLTQIWIGRRAPVALFEQTESAARINNPYVLECHKGRSPITDQGVSSAHLRSHSSTPEDRICPDCFGIS